MAIPAAADEPRAVSTITRLNLTGDDFLQIAAQPTEGFNFPYFLFIPAGVDRDSPFHILVEPNNTGTATDDFTVHLSKARNLAKSSYACRIAAKLQTPLLVPAFPRPGKDGHIYTHALDRDSLTLKEGPLYRLDLQLAAMFSHARKLLRHNGFEPESTMFMDGFSASAKFVNRFAFLHPELIKAVASGGVNGLPVLPVKTFNGRELPFPIGIADLEEFLGRPFDEKAYWQVAQYIYMGYLDRNDTVPSRDAWSEAEATIIKTAIAEEMMPDRWRISQQVYREQQIRAQLVTYNGVGHGITDDMEDDIARFFQANTAAAFVPIQPCDYPFVEYRQIHEGHGNALYWTDDPRIPDWIQEGRHACTFMIGLQEWYEKQDYRQLAEFKDNAGFNFVLQAEGQRDIEINEDNYAGTCSQGNGRFQAFWVRLDDAQLKQILPGRTYRLTPVNKSTEYFWTVNNGLTLTRTDMGTLETLNTTVLPGRIAVDKAPIPAAIAAIEQAMAQALTTKTLPKFVIGLKPEELSQCPGITFSAEGLTAMEFLWIVCHRAALQYRIAGNTVYIETKE
ncbi:MAG: hypothetical protein IH624_12720 [Phycisphaerae bacterium]|nr:hypothetical protein [Phycisphaerae bacterium]